LPTVTTAIATLLFAAAPTTAAPPCAATTAPCPPAEALDPAALEAARAFLRASDFEAQLVQTARRAAMASLVAMVERTEIERGETVPSERMERIRNVMLAGVEEVVGEIKANAMEEAAATYARHFTADELREMSSLYEQPVGIKFKQLAPVLITQLESALNATVERSSAVEARIQAELDAWEQSSGREAVPVPN
jgi:hypothetical protein